MSVRTPEAQGKQPVSEAIVVVDLVDSTKTTTRHGWYAVGRHVVQDLRACIIEVGERYGLSCRKFTGDGYMLAFSSPGDAAHAVLQALHAITAIARAVNDLNASAPQERRIRLRFALHYGEVDVVEEARDREGPTVSYTFRLEGVDAESLKKAISPMPAERFPSHDYAIVSERVFEMLRDDYAVAFPWEPEPIGVLPLKGFDGYHQPYLVRNLSALHLQASEVQ